VAQLYPQAPTTHFSRLLRHAGETKFRECLLQLNSEYFERIVLLDFIHRLVSQKIEELNIYTKYHNTHVQNSHKGQLLTTEPITWVHTHINPCSKSDTGGNK
jgi:hypothetical protein